MSLLRDILRRRLRSALTICGVAVGVFALVVLGAMAEKANMTLEKNAQYYAGKVVVVEKQAAGSGLGFGFNNTISRPLTREKLAEIEAYPGVRDVAPQVILSVDQEALPIGTQPLVIGGFAGSETRPEGLEVARGRLLDESERGVAVVGSNLVEKLDAEVGGSVTVRGADFEVVGITTPSHTVLDDAVIVPLGDAQRLALKTLPPVFAASVEASSLIGQATAYVEPGVDADDLSTRLDRDVEGIHATGPTGLKKQLAGTLSMFAGLLVSAGTIALVVGCLSVMNTMLMSLSERNREMGLKRALGASGWRIARDVLAESAVLGLIGGMVGLAAGTAVAAAVDAAGAGGGVFLVTGRLAVGALAFSAILGGAAGLYPAWRTVRTDPLTLLASR